ncbi:MAG: hypothetical protein QNK36_17990 [Colwellia sp.]|nr:hypothetical protein [Colwellia sp.]
MMAKQSIVKSVLKASGQSQSERTAVALSSDYVAIDAWTKSELMDYMQAFAKHINFYQEDSEVPSGDWQSFFPFILSNSQQSIEQQAPNVTPHIALLQAFVELYKYPQQQINQLTDTHLDFYYKTVLRMKPKPAVNDKAHLVLRLKKNSPITLIDSSHSFSAGKDSLGVERLYKPTKSNIVNHALVSSIRSVFIDPVDNQIKHAPIANSQDGLGDKVTTENGSWHGFGQSELPLVAGGFALSSNVLLLTEGERTITVKIKLSELTVASFLINQLASQLANAFLVSFSGDKGWLEPITISPKLSGNMLELVVVIAKEDELISPYLESIHGYNFETTEPVMQIWVNQENSAISYSELAKLQIETIQIFTKVKGVKQLKVENDLGKLNAKKSFMPFGAQPYKDMRLYVGYGEALDKKLSFLALNIEWQDTPTSFTRHYRHYKTPVKNSTFKVSVTFTDGGSWQESVVNRPLFDTRDASEIMTISFGRGISEKVVLVPKNQQLAVALAHSNQQWVKSTAVKLLLKQPTLSSFLKTPITKDNARRNTIVVSKRPVKTNSTTRAVNDFTEGFITLSLERDFLHEEYRQQTIKNALAFSKSNLKTPIILNEPYTPSIAKISLDYSAYTDVIEMDDDDISAFASDETLFFHLSYAGQHREHSFMRTQFEYLTDKSVSLVPAYKYNGELLIGLSNLSPSNSINLLVTVAEGSADPEVERAVIEWSILSDNYWKPLNKDELVSDTTNNFLTSGIINLVIPAQATVENSILPSPNIWLKVGLTGKVNAVCDIIDIQANGVEVVLGEQQNSEEHLKVPLPAGTITKLKTPIASVKSVNQPTASFGGQPKETAMTFRTRTSERLRHKNRALTLWDIERVLLNEFPFVYKVKCLPHSTPNHWNSPGHVTAIVIPNLYNQNSVDPFRPKVSSQALSVAENLLASIGAMQVQYHVTNPRYYQIRIGFGVKFKLGFEFNYYSRKLNQKIIQFLTPWMRETNKDIYFGGIIYKSEILDFIEELPFVDYLTDFTLAGYENEQALVNNHMKDASNISVTEPDMIMVSVKEHDIYQIE